MKQGILKRYFPIFVLPTFLSFLLVFVIPFVMGLLLSFTEFSTVENATFVGFANYIRAFEKGDGFLRSLGFTSLLALCVVIAVNFVALSLALLLTKRIRFTALFRGVFFLPNLIGGIVLGYIWNLLLGGGLSYFGLGLPYLLSRTSLTLGLAAFGLYDGNLYRRADRDSQGNRAGRFGGWGNAPSNASLYQASADIAVDCCLRLLNADEYLQDV